MLSQYFTPTDPYSPKSTPACTRFFCSVLTGLLFSPVLLAQQAPLVQIAKVEAWQGGATNNLHCEVTAPYLHQVTSQGEAKLNWILPAGSQVIKGQLLAEQDSFYLLRNLEKLENDRAFAQSQLDYNKSEYDRLNSLRSQQLVSVSQLNDLLRQKTQAKLLLQRLDIQIFEARHRLDHSKHFAQISGQVVETQAMPGAHLDIGDPVLSLLAQEDKELTCELPLAKYRQSNQLKNVQFSLGERALLTIKRRDFQLQQDTQSLRLYLALNAAPGQMRSPLFFGERLEVLMRYQKPGLSKIPYDAMELQENGYFIWQLSNDNTVQRLPVKLVSSQTEHFLIESSLVGGETLITLGKKGLSNGQQVIPSRADKLTDNKADNKTAKLNQPQQGAL